MHGTRGGTGNLLLSRHMLSDEATEHEGLSNGAARAVVVAENGIARAAGRAQAGDDASIKWTRLRKLLMSADGAETQGRPTNPPISFLA